jgi:murein DD-endopeptidase MepM/ murein hydrolase activator NlpD
MRSVVLFLIGCVLGATAILLYLTETQQLAHAKPARGAVAETIVSGRPVPPAQTGVSVPHDSVSVPHDSEPLLMPVEGISPARLKSTFDESRGGGFRTHHAIDILAPRGTPVRAAVPGTIKKLFTSRAGGITIYEFDRAEDRCYYYAHLDRYAPNVVEGMEVAQGDVIGYVGTTGNAPAKTPHLHFAIMILPPTKEWWKGEPIDPYPLLVGE